MNRILLTLTTLLFIAVSCNDNTEITPPKEELSKPEQIEKNLREIAGRGWGSLADTLTYFNKEFILHGRTAGIGPDGVYYSLTESDDIIRFTVQDSIFLSIDINNNYSYVRACNTDFLVEYEGASGIAVTIDNICLTAESISERKIDVYYYGEPCGYIVWEHFENTDYTDGSYPVMHYFNDSRTFAFYENVYFFELWKLIGYLKS